MANRALQRVPRDSSVRVTSDGAPFATAIREALSYGESDESDEKSSHLFYLIIALIVLGFIASFAFPIKAQEHKPTDTSRFVGHFVPAADNS